MGIVVRQVAKYLVIYVRPLLPMSFGRHMEMSIRTHSEVS